MISGTSRKIVFILQIRTFLHAILSHFNLSLAFVTCDEFFFIELGSGTSRTKPNLVGETSQGTNIKQTCTALRYKQTLYHVAIKAGL